jgi:beta-aspartyl-peptidase (threonine type)
MELTVSMLTALPSRVVGRVAGRMLTCACAGLLAASVTMTAAAEQAVAVAGAPVAIAIHGGSGTINKGEFTPERENEIRATLEQAVRAGHEILTAGGSSLDAVTRAVVLLEDSPHFNAGRGAVFNAEGRNELDASIMNGNSLQAGAVAGVHNVRNPVLLARKVMTDSPHVMLMGAGAEAFAREQGIVFEDDAYFFNEYRWQQLQKAKAGVETGATFLSETPDQWFSTVGAVALDRSGNLAAATSTGGMTNKRWGRVGIRRSSAPAPTPTTAPARSAPPGTASTSSGRPSPVTSARACNTAAPAWRRRPSRSSRSN